MRIVIDQDFGPTGMLCAEHVVHTDNVADLASIVKVHNGTTPALAAGWNIVSSHPTAGGKTRLQFLLAEVVRLNDPVARAALGV